MNDIGSKTNWCQHHGPIYSQPCPACMRMSDSERRNLDINAEVLRRLAEIQIKLDKLLDRELGGNN